MAARQAEAAERREPTATQRRTRSLASLEKLLTRIEAGSIEMPDWIVCEGDCRLERLVGGELPALATRIFRCVRRGVRPAKTDLPSGDLRLEFWRTLAAAGFHDFGSWGFTKRYASPFAESFDYIGPYLEGGLDALDPYLIYSSVLGTHDFSAQEFLTTELCSDVEAVVEPMAGTAEFSREGHFLYPHLRYVMIDLDEEAKCHVDAQPWLEGSEHHYLVADVLDKQTWREARSLARGRSLAYIGKQSHHLFNAEQIMQLLEVATQHVDLLMLETPQISLVSSLTDFEELTRPEMEDAGFRVALINEPGGDPNPFTNEMDFRLDAWDNARRRTLFRYHGWTAWYPPTLVAFAEIVGLDAFYYNEAQSEFVPVRQAPEDNDDCYENPTFMIFKRRASAKDAKRSSARAPRRPKTSASAAATL